MRPVLIAVFCLYAGVALAAPLTCVKPGTERWPVKISVPSGAPTVKMTLADALSDAKLPPLKDVKTDDPRYQKVRITDQPVKEDRLVTVSGWLYLVAFEADDCDFHIQISPKPLTSANPPGPDDNSMIVEAPSGSYAKDISGTVEGVRSWVIANLLKGTDPVMGSIHVMQHPVYVSVTGALFYDDAHEYRADHTTGRGKKKLDSKTLWELHPITAIAFTPPPAH
jgi:hypothetical protein